MSVPSGFAEWCDWLGVSLVPAQWDAETHVAYRQWKLARFRAHVRHYRDLGQWDLIRQQSGRAALVQLVRAQLDAALTPAPPQVYGRSSHTLPTRRDVGGQYPVMGPVMLGTWARIVPTTAHEERTAACDTAS